MAYSSQKIIEDIEKRFPSTNEPIVKHMSTLDIENNLKPQQVFQYLIDVTADESYRGGGIGVYENNVKEKLKYYQFVGCSPWHFTGDEIDELSRVLSELSEHYNAGIDVEKVLRKANVKEGNGAYYLVISVIAYTFLLP